MADKPGTGGPGLFRKRTPRADSNIELIPGAPPVDVPPASAISILGLLSRLQQVEGALSALRREKILAGEEFQAAATGTENEVLDLQAEIVSLREDMSFVDGVIRATIEFVKDAAFVPLPGDPERILVQIFSGSTDRERAGREFIVGLIARLRSMLDLP